MDEFVHYLLDAAAAAVAAGVVGLIAQWFRKLGLQIDAQQYARAREIVKGVVLEVEERVASQVKAGVIQPGVSTAKLKLEKAVSRVIDQLPNVDQAEAALLVKEAVARAGLGASDFFGKAEAAMQSPKS